MEAILRQCGCDFEIAVFQEQGIDDEAFRLLSEPMITELVPRLGPRLKLLKKLKEYNSQLQSNKMKALEFNTESNDALEHMITNSFAISDVPSQISLSQIEVIPFASTCEMQNKCTDIIPFDNNQKPKVFVKGGPSNLFPGGLENLLKKSVDGQMILARKERLNNELRQKLCKEIVNHFFTICDEFSTSLFTEASAEICRLFLNESQEIYFIPYKAKTGNQPKESARGKLWSRYVNVRAALKQANNLQIPNTHDTTECMDAAEDAIAYDVLKTLLEPQTKILRYWKKTYEYRRRLFKNKNINVSKILDDVPALKLNSIGPDLISSDFNQMYPDKIDNVYLQFPKMASAILKEAKERKVCVVENTFDVEEQLAAAVTLPYLFAPISIRTATKKTWRPSKSEIVESFVIHIMNFHELEDIVEKRKAKLNKYKLTVQPFLVILGDLNNPEAFYVCLDEVKFTFDTFLRAFEVIFKLFHGFDVCYPLESQHIWTFLEEMLFGLKTSRRNSASAALIADLQKFLGSDNI